MMDYLPKLNEISSILSKEYPHVEEYGLMSGTTGISLFFYAMYMWTGESRYKQLMLDSLDRSIDIASNNPLLPTYAGGLSGLGCYISFLEKRGLVEDYIDEDIDDALLNALEYYIEQNYYDFLHGAIGVAFYFYYRHVNTGNSASKQVLRRIVEWLYTTKQVDCNGIKWESYNKSKEKNEYNISLSHGMASILAFLMKLKDVGDFPDLSDKIDSLITNSAQYINAQKIDYNTYGSFYGYIAVESQTKPEKSRLAWCYGDLGVAYTLKNYGKLYRDTMIYNDAIKTLQTDAEERRGLIENMVVDAGLCHGSSGIALIYNNLYHDTGLDSFKDAADYWIDQTIRLGKFENEYAGYKIYYPQRQQWYESYGLLEGIAGIGLSLASHIYGKTCGWDELLLLK